MSSLKNNLPVVLYRYEASPFANKVENVLALKSIPYYEVNEPVILPRPDINEMLGIGYRRIPVLAIGNDVYCDTSLIAPTLEKYFPQSQGFSTIFPLRKDGGKADSGMIKAFATFYCDRTLFAPAMNSLPYEKFSSDFIADRGKWLGAPLNVEAIIARQPAAKSIIASHLTLLEEQLADGREWLFDTLSPGYGDVSVFLVFGWLIRFKNLRDVLSTQKFPYAISWIGRMADFINEKKKALAPSIQKIDGAVAAKIIADASKASEVLFDEDEAGRLGLKRNDLVSVVPDDNAKNYPTNGKLVGLSREEVVIELGGSRVSSLYCHFPRFNYSIKPVSGVASKL